MPYRKTHFVNEHFYHVLNRGIGKKLIFKTNSDYRRALQITDFYRFPKPTLRFSSFLRLSVEDKSNFLEKLYTDTPLVEIISYCFMPNHTHFLIKQTLDNGISKFMANWQNSYARYFNTKYKQTGYLFESSFKAKYIEMENLLWHVSRYIHLNPSTASLVSIKNLKNYPWSSFPEYLKLRRPEFTSTKLILSHFKGRKAYENFVYNQAAYQKKLKKIKDLSLE